jgi:hypothetical protein
MAQVCSSEPSQNSVWSAEPTSHYWARIDRLFLNYLPFPAVLLCPSHLVPVHGFLRGVGCWLPHGVLHRIDDFTGDARAGVS